MAITNSNMASKWHFKILQMSLEILCSSTLVLQETKLKLEINIMFSKEESSILSA